MKKKYALLPLMMLLGLSLSCGKKASCSDGIKNKGETSADCGGPCPTCGTCQDKIQNQDETGIDCGGICSPCASCSDGMQNQGETGIDCGGPCAKCPITYPSTGEDSPNILQQGITSVTSGKVFHLKADLPANTSLRVGILNLSANTSTVNTWYYNPDGYVGWHLIAGPAQPGFGRFDAQGRSVCDLKMYSRGHGSARVDLYENGASIATKTVTW